VRCGCVCSSLIFSEMADEGRRAIEQEKEALGKIADFRLFSIVTLYRSRLRILTHFRCFDSIIFPMEERDFSVRMIMHF
jgi:hypothetical protein